MAKDSQWEYSFSSQLGMINVILLVSSIIQTLMFWYHMYRHDWTSKLPHLHEWLEYFAVVFFIAAMTLSELNVSWNKWMKIDVTLDAYIDDVDEIYNHSIQWLGIAMCIIGNILFFWIERHLDRGINSPLFLNDVSIHNIDINITHCDTSNVSYITSKKQQEADAKNKEYWSDKALLTDGPYSYCRHPIYLIWAIFEFGYLLCSGSWFEYCSFTTFIVVEALRVDIIDKSLLFKYQQEYVDYVVNTPNFMFPALCGGYCCSLDLAYCSCCGCECQRWEEFKRIHPKQKGEGLYQESKEVNLLVNVDQVLITSPPSKVAFNAPFVGVQPDRE